MSILKRSWTDFEKWSMDIFAALIIAAFLAVSGVATNLFRDTTDPMELQKVALLVGYDSAAGLALSNLGADTTKLRAEANANLSKLGIERIRYPTTVSDKTVTDFANSVIGNLSAKSSAQTCAFQLGFAGLVETNTPGIYPNFSVRDTADCAGFADQPDLSDTQFLENLVKNARL